MNTLALPPNTKCILATCNLNQWALDFDGNQKRIEDSIRQAKALGAKYRLGPELEITGYSCEDHFYELDTFFHTDQTLADILSSDLTHGILCDFGAPVLHNNVRYNCRVFCLDGKIVLIRPKMYLADDGNYRERRWFTSWKADGRNSYAGNVETHLLSQLLRNVTGQETVPFGVAGIQTMETIIASEVCEELWAPLSPHVHLMLAGVEIVSNGSGSHHQLRKLGTRLDLMKNASAKCGGVYMYSNQRGCDGNRLYFDGASLVCANGLVVAQGTQFSLKDVEVITAVVDLNDVRSHRNSSASIQEQSSSIGEFPIINLTHFSLASSQSLQLPSTKPITPHIFTPEEECALGPACWLWDYLRRSGAAGYMLPLSGGADSASVAAIVTVMCGLAVDTANSGDANVIKDIHRLLHAKASSTFDVSITSETLCNSILHTVYVATENSSIATTKRAELLASSIGSYHNYLNIDIIVKAIITVFENFTNKTPRYLTQGGVVAEDVALQNIQARIRMVMSYLCAQLLPWVRGRSGFLLVLGSANVDEALRGYMTKYDCSSADINPIGGICKSDLKKMMLFVANKYDIQTLSDIADAPPSAELRPLAADKENYDQTDEEDMGMLYDELGTYGYLRKVERCGPVSMFNKLLEQWQSSFSISEIAEKVKKFFYFYSINRHKMTVLTPSYHAESYSPDDNRFDLRQFLYNNSWTRQFNTIDALVKRIETR